MIMLLALLGLLCSSSTALAAQQMASITSIGSAAATMDLPDAPGRQTAPPQASDIQPGTASISGVVLDINDGIVPNATVKLVEDDRPGERTETSDAEGRFTFTGLPAGKFRVTLSAPGLSSFVSNEIVLHPGERHEMAQIGLPPTTSLDAQVTVTQVEIAQEQIELQEKQRAFGVFPNFFSSYVWDAAPLTSKQKFELSIKSVTDPVVFAATGVFAGVEQALDVFHDYGQGVQGYAKRYGAGYADEAIARMLSNAILPSILRQDPRYFYRGSGSIRTRAWYALTRAVVTRGNNGLSQPNYSRVLGGFASGALSNLYRPEANRGVGLVLRNSFIAIGGHAADNLLREFLFKRVTTNVPDYAKGKPEETAPAAKK